MGFPCFRFEKMILNYDCKQKRRGLGEFKWISRKCNFEGERKVGGVGSR
jgi:hypothetical protein